MEYGRDISVLRPSDSMYKEEVRVDVLHQVRIEEKETLAYLGPQAWLRVSMFFKRKKSKYMCFTE